MVTLRYGDIYCIQNTQKVCEHWKRYLMNLGYDEELLTIR